MICPSPIHGYGCFATGSIPAGALVWAFNPKVDRVLRPSELCKWERLHAYGSNASGRFILPGDNAAWINFAARPNLVEAEKIGEEFCLRACRPIEPYEELTVFTDTDTDHHWKMNNK